MAKQFTREARRRLALAAGVDEQYLYQCLTGRRDMNPAKAVLIEERTRGEITRRDVCQKTFGSIWRELAIPEAGPAGAAETSEATAADSHAMGGA